MKKRVLSVFLAMVMLFALSVPAFAHNDADKSHTAKHSITYDTAGGNNIASQGVNHNCLTSKPKDPVKKGYVFLGWYHNGSLFNFSKTKVNKNITLSAKWEKKPVTTSVTIDLKAYHDAVNTWYDLHDALNEDVTHTAESIEAARNLLNSHPDVAAHGLAVIGSYDVWNGQRWLNENKKYTQEEIDQWAAKLNVVLKEAKALLKIKTVSYTVTFDSGGGSLVDSQKAEAGSLLAKPENPVKDGYTFEGWYYISPDYTTLFNFDDMRVNWDITLTAKWAEATKYWTVTFDSNGGNLVDSQKLEPNSRVTKPQDPVKYGYTFAGWYYNSTDYTTLFNFDDMRVNWDITLTAKWTANSKISEDKKAKPDVKKVDTKKVDPKKVDTKKQNDKKEDPKLVNTKKQDTKKEDPQKVETKKQNQHNHGQNNRR